MSKQSKFLHCIKFVKYLANITNSRKDLDGKAQLCITDHVSPSIGMGGRESQSCLMPYIRLKASESADLQAQHRVNRKSMKAPADVRLGLQDDLPTIASVDGITKRPKILV